MPDDSAKVSILSLSLFCQHISPPSLPPTLHHCNRAPSYPDSSFPWTCSERWCPKLTLRRKVPRLHPSGSVDLCAYISWRKTGLSVVPAQKRWSVFANLFQTISIAADTGARGSSVAALQDT